MTKMKLLIVLVALSATVTVQAGLLEMSQELWAKLISGGLAKVGQLDPLRVPVIKVDQSEGNTSYRMVLRNMEIVGLNDSVLESVHLARGRLKSNLSELEAGYVSYSDLRGMDSIRYRFHTLLKQPRTKENDGLDDGGATARENRFERLRQFEPKGSRSQDVQAQQDRQSNQYATTQQYDSQYAREQGRQYQQSQYSREQDGQYQQDRHRSQYATTQRYDSQYAREDGRQYQQSQYPREQDRQYQQNPQRSQYEREQDGQYQQDRRGSQFEQTGQYDYQRSETEEIQQRPVGSRFDRIQQAPRQFSEGQSEEIGQAQQASYDPYYSRTQTSAAINYEKQGASTAFPTSSYGTTTRGKTTSGQRNSGDGYQGFRAHVDPVSGSVYMRGSRIPTPMSAQRSAALKAKEEINPSDFGSRYPANVDVIYAETGSSSLRNSEDRRAEDQVDCFGKQNSNEREKTGEFREFLDDAEDAASENVETKTKAGTRLENQPGYIDIVYADGKENGSVKHFGNLRIDPRQDTKVYNLDDIMKDIRNSRRFIVHNVTKGEPLSKRNDAMKAALETKNLKNLSRYAEEYQEKQGYFEEGMQLIYHYGNQRKKDVEDVRSTEAIRKKRAHLADEVEDDVMHVILRIRVPMLRVKSQYQLMGKVGQEILRGNGLLTGNFTELVADFTVELKKSGEDLMIVRAARAKLVSKDRNVSLQGMDDKGPVESVLNYGLMAAEAVAAMLADDLATKALSEKTADAMIYKMYKNLPTN